MYFLLLPREFFLFGKFLFISIFFLCSLNASTLYLSISTNPLRLNPILATDSASSTITNWLFDGLLKYDKKGELICNLAKNYKFEDNQTILFELKDNIYWHDGVKFSVDDIIFTYNTVISKKVFTPYSDSFRFVESVEKIDELKVKIRYKKPYFKALEIWTIDIIPKHMLQNETNLMNSSFNQKPIGTGAYKLETFEFSKNIKLVANPTYHEHKPFIDEIIYQFLPEQNSRFMMLKNRELDIGDLTYLQYQRQLNDEFYENYNIYNIPTNAYTYLGFNLKNPKFQDKRVREAIELGIDKQELIDLLFFKQGKVCNGPFLEGSFAFNSSIKTKKRDIEKAKKLLQELGYNENTPLEFEIITNSNNPTRLYTAQIIQHQLKSINIKVKIRALEWQAFLNTVVHPRKFETIILGWSLSLMPDAYLIWHSQSDKVGGFNFVGYKNSVVDNLIEESEAVVDREILAKMYQEIFKLIVEDIPYIFLYVPDGLSAINSQIKPIEPSIIGIMHNQIDWIKD